MMKDLNWILMLDILAGAKFTNYGLNQMAQLNCGEVIETKQYTLMTDRNYEPTSAERFANRIVMQAVFNMHMHH